MAFYPQIRRGSRRQERGYVLLALLLTMALLVVFAAALMPSIKFQIERDREEELIHRGTQYSRAIRGYYKKFGRYPMKIEDLESTNNLKFLRRRYKDPTNCIAGVCQDFKLLHFGEVRLVGGMLGIPGAQTLGSPGAITPAQNSAAGVNAAIAGQVAGLAASGGLGANNNSPFPNNQGAGQPGSDSSTAGGDASNPSGSPGSDNSGGNSGGGTTGSSSGPGSGQVFGGGPIVGVVSTNKKDTYREFNHKKKYNEWQFIYDPGIDRGGLMTTPSQPPLQPMGQQGTQNVNGQNGGTTPTGLPNNPTPPVSEPPAAPNDPNNPPEQK